MLGKCWTERLSVVECDGVRLKMYSWCRGREVLVGGLEEEEVAYRVEMGTLPSLATSLLASLEAPEVAC